MSEALDEAFDEATEVMRKARQRLAGLEQDARRSRLSMEADVSADRKTRKRTEGAASADRAKHIGDSSSAQVDPDPMCLTSFGDDSIETLALHPREDALVIDKERIILLKALRRQSRVSHPWRCVHVQLPVAYFPPAQPLQ
ncbi:unnamed protein product [Ascophyllum nodosum]